MMKQAELHTREGHCLPGQQQKNPHVGNESGSKDAAIASIRQKRQHVASLRKRV